MRRAVTCAGRGESSTSPSQPRGSRALLVASMAFACGCGARSDLDTTRPESTTRPEENITACGGHHNGAGGGEAPGCELRAYEVSGAEPGPLILTIPAPSDGYWLPSSNLALVGSAPEGTTFQLWGDDIATLCSGGALPLVPTTQGGHGARVVLRWWRPGALWASTSGTLDVIAYEPGPLGEPRPAHFEVHGAQMAPSPEDEPGEAVPGNATGTFAVDLSCRLEKFWAY